VIRKDIIVVGGGIAGLTAALSLAHKGSDVLLIEKNERCGGLMNSFERDGFRFEGGTRALVNAGLVKPLMREFALDVEILPNPISLVIEDNLVKIDGPHSLSRYAEVLKSLYPESRAEVDRIIQAIQNTIADMQVLYGIENPLFSKKKKNMLSRVPLTVARMPKMLRTLHRISQMNISFEEYLDSIANNQSLKDIVGQHFFRKTPVFFALSYFALYNEYIYPKGGVGAFIQNMAEAVESRGGEIHHNTEIVSIDAQNKILNDTSGNEYQYQKMIWAGDLKTLYTITNDTGMTKHTLGQFRTHKQAILAQGGAESVFSVFLAADQPPHTFSAQAGAHVFYTPSRRGLGTIHTTELRTLLQNWDTVGKEEFYAWLERFCRWNTFEISIPVLRDPDAAPPGKTGMIISTLFDYKLTSRIRARGWYKEFKQRFTDMIIMTVSSRMYPGLAETVLFSFSASPWSIYNRVGSAEGSIVGWSFEGTIPVVTRMSKMGSSVNTALPDVYAAGKWVYSPAGGPTAIITGRIAAKKCSSRIRRNG